MPVNYKTLFEIKLLHEYFLTRSDGSNIFENPGQQGRMNYLQEEFKNDRESINEDIYFEFPQSQRLRYASSFLKLLPAYSGCRVVVRVNPQKLADETIVYEPAVPLTNELNIFILVLRKNIAIDTYTNTRIKRPMPSIYFFSNSDLLGAKTFPFLTNSMPVQDSSLLYEQGELSLSGNIIQEYYREGGTDKWNDVAGSGYANESDRLLLSGKFEYAFRDTTNLTEAIFTLKDNNGNMISSLIKNDSGGLREKLTLDFSDRVKMIPLAEAFHLTEYIYLLEVSGNNGYSGNHRIIFSNELTTSRPWAVLHIRTAVTNTAFNLFANDGFIFRRKDPMDVWTPAPLFEIPIKSRSAYWRFISDQHNELIVSAGLNDYVNKEGQVLVTKKPRSLSRSWFKLRKEASNDTVYVPNPVSPVLKLETDRRLFIDIRVPQSELFPEAP